MTVNGVEYEVVRLLGKGKGDYYQFGDKLQSELRKIGVPMPEMLAVDAENERILKAYIPGDTVDRLILADRLPDWCIPHMEELCAHLCAANTNIDYFPTNFIPLDGVLYYVDYECNDYMQYFNK